MAELEIHHEHGETDRMGQRVGIQAALLAVALCMVTIASHRAHTEAIVLKTEANDKWQFYQSKRLKLHNLELGEDLIGALGPNSEAAGEVLKRYKAEKERYAHEGKEVSGEAKEKEAEARKTETRALRYDIGEGLLEIGLVLSSLYFISKKRLFPVLGLAGGLVGIVIAATGLLA
jgi:hypothetical protein